HTRFSRDWSSDVCSSDLEPAASPPTRSWPGRSPPSPTTLRPAAAACARASAAASPCSPARPIEQELAMTDFTMYAVVRATRGSRPGDAERLAAADSSRAEGVSTSLAAIPGLRTRGWYDVAGFRADAELLVWWHADA